MSLSLQIEKRLEPVEVGEGNAYQESGEAKSGCTIFLGYTSNLISSGVRESIRYLAEHKMVDYLWYKIPSLQPVFTEFSWPICVRWMWLWPQLEVLRRILSSALLTRTWETSTCQARSSARGASTGLQFKAWIDKLKTLQGRVAKILLLSSAGEYQVIGSVIRRQQLSFLCSI